MLGSLQSRLTQAASSSWPSCGVACRSCWRGRIELATPRAPAPVIANRGDRAIRLAWKGSFESIGFPFQTGALDHMETRPHAFFSSFDFDDAGDRILIVGHHGLLFSCRIDGTEAEVLPRGRGLKARS